MNRTDRLYALVDELRAVAPRARTARQMAARFEVSVRTIERDLGALQQAGVPIYATPGPGGGYAVDRDHTLPPCELHVGGSDGASDCALASARVTARRGTSLRCAQGRRRHARDRSRSRPRAGRPRTPLARSQ
ncbi:MAG: helix-turn-helix transcriptional regulator [Acidimicrobiales bacterium]